MGRLIAYTRHDDGGVSLCRPSDEVLRALSLGGYWDDRPRGFAQRQIENHIKGGIHPDHARRYVNAMVMGGCTTAEAYDIIKDRDCYNNGHTFDIIDDEDIPGDRWFRDAWRRSSNGGPPVVRLELARPIHWGKLRNAVESENKRRREAFNVEREIAFDPDRYRTAIRHARDEEELRRIWSPELSSPLSARS